MPDVSHQFGSDISISASGDIAIVEGTVLGQQRVLRRLLTNAGDYIWHLAYGAGLGGFVGQPANADRIAAVTRAQMYLEAVVTRNPAPTISVTVTPDGTVTEMIQYVDAPSGQTVVLSLPPG